MSLRAGRFLAFAAALLLGACKPAPNAAKGPTRPLSEWVGDSKQLFDDGIDTGAVPLGDAPPSRDETNEALIPQRMDLADAVVLTKVIGVHSEPVGDRKRYRLELVVEGTPLYAAAEPPTTFSLTFPPDSPSYGTIRALDARLIGRKLVVFYRGYADDDGGDGILHFHLSPATKAVLDTIELHKTKKQFN